MIGISPLYRSITDYVCDPLIMRMDDLAAEDTQIHAGAASLDWGYVLLDWRTWELMHDLTGCLDAGGVL